MCPSEALSPVGKEEIPGVGGSLSCEKSKWEAKAMDSLWRLCLFVSFWTAQRLRQSERESIFFFLCPILMAVSGHHLGVVTSWFLPHGWKRTLIKRGKKRKGNERPKKWELNKCIIQRRGRRKRGRQITLISPPRYLLMWRWCLHCTVTTNNEREREAERQERPGRAILFI